MASEALIRVDLHTHTWYSADALTSPAELVRRARVAGLNRVAVTDHGSIAGALEAQAEDPDLVIVGEEIRCACGTDIIGLFLQEWIAPGQDLEEAALQIRRQGGVVYAPHPYSYITIPGRRAARVMAVADVVEVFNSRAVLPMWNRRAREAQVRLGIPGVASSDGHMPWELGRGSTEMPWFQDAEGFLSSVAEARIGTAQTGSAFLHLLSFTLQGFRTLLGRGHGLLPWPGRANDSRGAEQRTPRDGIMAELGESPIS